MRSVFAYFETIFAYFESLRHFPKDIHYVCLSAAKLKRRFEFLVIDYCAVYSFFFEEFALGERLLYLSIPPISEA